uniref:Putative ovule protein n=1 Tax=Solanum chacoense TaxID=4108 RepID=A0A0V0IKY8_SOLCH
MITSKQSCNVLVLHTPHPLLVSHHTIFLYYHFPPYNILLHIHFLSSTFLNTLRSFTPSRSHFISDVTTFQFIK